MTTPPIHILTDEQQRTLYRSLNDHEGKLTTESFHAIERLHFLRTRKLAIEGYNPDMEAPVINKCSFGFIWNRILDQKFILTQKRILHRIVVLTARAVDLFPQAVEMEQVNVRVFLGAYGCAYFPDSVFPTKNELSNDLTVKAKELLKVYDNICRQLSVTEDMSGVRKIANSNLVFQKVLFSYLQAFETWKVPDLKHDTICLTNTINRLADAEAALINGDADEQKMRKILKLQQNSVCLQLCQRAGQHVFDTLNAALVERGMSACQAILFTPPIPVGTVRKKRSLFDIERVQMTQLEMVHEVRINQNYRYDEDGDDGSMNPATKKYKRIIESVFWISLPDDLRLDTPVYKNITTVLDELHDIINHMQASVSNFKGTTKISNVLQINRICDKTKKGALDWNSCVTMIKTVHGILNECQSAFETPTYVVEPQLEQEDVEMMETNIAFENPEWNLLQERMQEAFNQVDTQPEVFRDGLKFLVENAKKNAISASNSNLRLVATKSLNDGIEYEKTQFDLDCTNKKNSLKNVRKFINKAVLTQTTLTTQEPQVEEPGDDEYIRLKKERDDYQRIRLKNLVVEHKYKEVSLVNVLDSAFVSLITQTKHTTVETCPETLLLDTNRIIKIQEAYGRMITICSIIALMQRPPYNHKLSTAWVSSVINEVMRLDIYGDSQLQANNPLIMEIVQKNMNVIAIAPDKITRLSNSFNDGTLFDSRVPTTMRVHLSGILLAGLRGEEYHLFDQDTTTAFYNTLYIKQSLHDNAQSVFRQSIDDIIQYVFQMGLELKIIMVFNLQVHKELYDKLIKDEANALRRNLKNVVYE